MNQEQARNLVRTTLTQSFDKARFRNFDLELLNKLDESKAFTSNKTYIKDAFKNHVEHFERSRHHVDLLPMHGDCGGRRGCGPVP